MHPRHGMYGDQGSYRHTLYLRSHHSLQRASPRGQYIPKQTLQIPAQQDHSPGCTVNISWTHTDQQDLNAAAHVGSYSTVSFRLKPCPGVRVPVLRLQMTFLGWSHPLMYLLLLMDETGKVFRLRFTS